MIELSPCKKGHPIVGAQGTSLGRDNFSAEIYKMSQKRQPGKKWGMVRHEKSRHH